MSGSPYRYIRQHLSLRIHIPISGTITSTFRIRTIPIVLQSIHPTILYQAAPLHTRTMADDASYSSFLNQASQPVSAQKETDSTSQARSKYDPTESHSSAPPSISSLLDTNPTYTSDTDSPFEPVFFSYAGSDLPSASDFGKCLSKSKSRSASGEIEELSGKDFDPSGQYKSVIDAVTQAGESGKGEIKIYRVETSKTRVEYYILTIGDDKRKLVGVVTKAVES